MMQSKQTYSEYGPSLDALSSELRKLIVSYLAPTCVEEIKPGWKLDLQHANLAHSCLREWVPEYLFRDMTLTHILPGVSCNLEIFAVTKKNAHLLKYVKHIIVQVPPAIRRDGLSEEKFLSGVDPNPVYATQYRLHQKTSHPLTDEMTEEQKQYCAEYHEAMIKPFTQSWRWYQLAHTAKCTFFRVFSHFDNLTSISVACCERVDQPRPTYTSTFILQSGKSVTEKENPRCVEDAAVNMGWASAAILHTAPLHVQNLQLSMANIDHFGALATVSQVLRIGYDKPPLVVLKNLVNITRLSLSVRGIAGTHGPPDPPRQGPSADAVWFWRHKINHMPHLRYLELIESFSATCETSFSDLEETNSTASILPWLLPHLALKELLELRLRGFALQTHDLEDALGGHWPQLQKITLDEIRLMDGSDDDYATEEHMEGLTWLDICHSIMAKQPGVRIHLERPSSTCFALDPALVEGQYIEELARIPGVVVTI